MRNTSWNTSDRIQVQAIETPVVIQMGPRQLKWMITDSAIMVTGSNAVRRIFWPNAVKCC